MKENKNYVLPIIVNNMRCGTFPAHVALSQVTQCLALFGQARGSAHGAGINSRPLAGAFQSGELGTSGALGAEAPDGPGR